MSVPAGARSVRATPMVGVDPVHSRVAELALPESSPSRHGADTPVRHNAAMTLFDVLDPAVPPDDPGGSRGVQPTAAGLVLAGPTSGVPARPDVDVVVRVSARRRKSSEARWVEGRIVVSVPAHLDPEARSRTVDWLVERLLARRGADGLGDDELLARATELSERYRLGAVPASVRWVTNQSSRWGSCSHHSGAIRISHRLQAVPGWVLDSVLVHEVAHLTHPDHSRAFHRLADAYPRHAEAGVFLAGYGLGLARRSG